MSKALVLISGGIDSIVTYYYAKKVLHESIVTPLFFKYNQMFQYQEVQALKKTLTREEHEGLIEMYLPSMQPTDGEFVPQRNLVFLSVALNYAETNGYDKIYTGFINVPEGESNNPYFDASKDFIDLMNKMSDSVKIIAPLIDYNKWQVIDIGKKLGIDLTKTWSCNFPVNGQPCGECGNCEIRAIAFVDNNISPV